MYPTINNNISTLNIESLSEERKELLTSLIEFINNKVAKKEAVTINFICTHNSRRSHLSQIWAQTMAHYFGIENVFCYSGGTESTAMFPMVGETLKQSGFLVKNISEGDNPVYSIKYAEIPSAALRAASYIVLNTSFLPAARIRIIVRIMRMIIIIIIKTLILTNDDNHDNAENDDNDKRK